MATAGIPSVEEMQRRQQQQAEAEDRRQLILEQILEPGAKDRLARLALVKKDYARSVEDSLIQAATNGKLPGKVSEVQLIQMLENLAGGDDDKRQGANGKKRVVVQRKKYGVDDDDDDDNDDDLA